MRLHFASSLIGVTRLFFFLSVSHRIVALWYAENSVHAMGTSFYSGYNLFL